MIKLISIFFLLLFQFSFGQLKINNVKSPNELMNVLLGDSEKIIVDNITFKGSPNAFGIFSCKLSYNTFIKEGIIMSTGDVKNALGPNDNKKASTKLNFLSDKDINIISGNKGCYDTALFEFDLVSKTDKIQFNFLFASEEYPEYVNKNVNDTFAFIVTNTNTKTSKNIAILNENENIPITVDNINHVNNSSYYTPNIGWNKKLLTTYKNDIQKLELPFVFQYDGFTKLLSATTNVIPNVKYHFKLGISDVGDQLYDSAIFLEANSLKSIGDFPESNNVVIEFNILFNTASSKIIGDESFQFLDQIIIKLKKQQNLKIKIIGHTDKEGSADYNKILSIKRAKSVASYLIDIGISKSRITTDGKGALFPKSDHKSENRRVEFNFYDQ